MSIPVLKFEDSPEANEYLGALQQGRQQLPAEASALEHKAVNNLRELTVQWRSRLSEKEQAEKEIERLKERCKQLQSQADLTSGEMTGYAKLLAMAEGSRREEAAAKQAAPAEAKNADAEPVVKAPKPAKQAPVVNINKMKSAAKAATPPKEEAN